MVPDGAYSPLNAQAALSAYDSFWGLLLPLSVPGRVADIWRAYLQQRVMRAAGLRVAFAAAPLVTQDRNAHNDLGDFSAEDKLYREASALIEWLREWHGGASATSLPELMLELWRAAVERGHLGQADVARLELWLQALQDAQYSFPPLKESWKTSVDGAGEL